MSGILEWLSGRKSYLIAFAIACLTLAMQMGWINQEVYEKVLAILGALGLTTLRAAISKGPTS